MKNFLKNNVSLESLTTIFSQAPVALGMLMGEDFTIEVANRQILELWGKGEDIIGLPLLEALPEIRDQEFPNILREVYQTGTPFNGSKVLGMIEKNGTLHKCYFNFIYAPIYGDTGITGISVVATDVTQQVEYEKKLRESELRFKELLEISDYATAIYRGEELVIEFANEQMIKTWGKDQSVIGKKLDEALPELQGQPFIDILKNIFITGIPYIAQEDRVDLFIDGILQTYYYSFSYKPLRDDDGEIYAIMNVAMDVTELVNSRKKAQNSESEYKHLAEAMPQIVWTTTADGKFDYYNKNLMNLLNCTEEEVREFNFEKIIHPEDIINLRKIWTEAAETQKTFTMEYRILDYRTDEYIWFLTRATPVIEDGVIMKWIGTSTNINEFKNLVNQKDTFLGIASHELKTPLTSLKLYAQVLERMLKKSGDDKNAEFAKKMDQQVIKLTSLIGDLLDVTKINAGKIHLNQNHFEFSQLVKETVEEQQMSTAHSIELNIEKGGTVFADRDRISQVITNLISNAIKYSPEAGKIIVETKSTDSEVTFMVKDFGIGMPEEKKDKVFEQYYRVSGDEESTFPGLGLGLYIASQIIDRSEGKIWVDSVLGKGSTFCFSLPSVQI
ncbi:PAS domain-containing sensor histidine kinase [Chryseobacterium sp.]|uniref:PAS domain-containing sensor histidine kinase n=1 Tax=Chryseobacterium sp. TaxID=1871047 RepID=UPI0011CAE78D|nr:PAS domain-containing sensor histidine kinase [Chryseobacterium sp.]TXF75053.1 PAS domain-containing sensor histidine kinase [Chryseobacterium sp.]